MKPKLIAATVALVAGVGVLLWQGVWRTRRPRGAGADQTRTDATRPAVSSPSAPAGSGRRNPTALYDTQIVLIGQPRDSAIREYVERTLEDKNWEWRIPIRFFGRVVDQSERPVQGATILLQWNDLSPSGTSTRREVSGQQGEFSLTNVTGKVLGVRVEKSGYYTVEGGVGMTSFEFANPAETNFYEPDEAHPVVFHLRKKGEGEPLLRGSVECSLLGDGSGQNIDLWTGTVGTSGPLEIKAWKPSPSVEPISAPYEWRVTMTIADGGFVEEADSFPFAAPDAGYVETVDLHMSSDIGPAWRVGVEKNYYFRFGAPPRYGRLSLRTNGDSKIVFIDYYLNPRVGSRNLEFNPAKAITPQP